MVLEILMENYRELRDKIKIEISEIRKGYFWAKDLVQDIETKLSAVEDDPLGSKREIDNLFLKLLDYQLVLHSLQEERIDLQESGVVLYSILHRRDYELLNAVCLSLVRANKAYLN